MTDTATKKVSGGTTTIRIEPGLKRRIKTRLDETGTNFNGVVIALLRRWTEGAISLERQRSARIDIRKDSITELEADFVNGILNMARQPDDEADELYIQLLKTIVNSRYNRSETKK